MKVNKTFFIRFIPLPKYNQWKLLDFRTFIIKAIYTEHKLNIYLFAYITV